MTEAERDKLIEVLMLVEDNMHTSASNIGLEQRGSNLRKAEKALMELLELDEGQCEELYWDNIEGLRE